jgi:hypothetical protein
MSQDKTSDLLKIRNATGSFIADLDGVRFLESKLFVYAETEKEFIIIGTDDFINTVDLSVPKPLESDGPLTVTFPTMGRYWKVMIRHFDKPVVEGVLIVTFSNCRKTVAGSFVLDLAANGKVTGDFNLTLDPDAK